MDLEQSLKASGGSESLSAIVEQFDVQEVRVAIVAGTCEVRNMSVVHETQQWANERIAAYPDNAFVFAQDDPRWRIAVK